MASMRSGHVRMVDLCIRGKAALQDVSCPLADTLPNVEHRVQTHHLSSSMSLEHQLDLHGLPAPTSLAINVMHEHG
jgi:hypothetical protein